MSQFSKKWEDLTIADNFIFCKVMENESLCKELLEILLGIKIEKINYIKSEHVIENFYDSRGVRLDVFVKDSDRVFDIEIQTGNYEDIILRSRYYVSACDVATTRRRTEYYKLKEIFIIFICLDDPFGMSLPVYTKKSIFLESNEIEYNDKVHNVFYNCSQWNKVQDEKLSDVMKFISGLHGKSDFVQKMEEAVVCAKADSSLKDEFMFVSDIIEEEKERAREAAHAEGVAAGRAEGHAKGLGEGRTEGLTEGHAKGLAEAKLEDAVTAVKEFNIPLEQVAEKFNVPLEELKKNL